MRSTSTFRPTFRPWPRAARQPRSSGAATPGEHAPADGSVPFGAPRGFALRCVLLQAKSALLRSWLHHAAHSA